MFKVGIIGLYCAILCLSGCATKPPVAVDYDSGYNFVLLKTFLVKEAKQDTKENILVSPFTLNHIHQVIGAELAKHYQAADVNIAPDFYVSYHVIMEEKIDPHEYDNLYGFGYWGGGYRYPSPLFYKHGVGNIEVYNQGSLIIDFIDGKTQQPIWRGVSEKRLNKRFSPQKQREILAGAVLEVLAKFPPVKQ